MPESVTSVTPATPVPAAASTENTGARTVAGPWNDKSLPPMERARSLVSVMTLAEKISQLGSSWPGAESAEGDVAPMQETHLRAAPFPEAVIDGLGQITRPFGTAPVDPRDGGRRLADLQRTVVAGNRFGIPAVAHEECLTGVTAWTATVYPTPLAWGASFDPDLVRQVGAAIGRDLRSLDIHQGLSPVLDVVRDYRWGRVEETIGEDPQLVAEVGSAYVEGLESAGIVATPKHFAGYSASRGARNHAPVSMGPRELHDVILPPFERALQSARSVMNAYTDTDGVPAGADRSLLTELLRERWGFPGTVVSDYWAISFLASMHHVAADESEAAELALRAGIDVELPHTLAFESLADRVASGGLSESVIDDALVRVLTQKAELGLLDAGWSPTQPPEDIDLDAPENRALARRLAEESIVLVQNDGILPLPAEPGSIAVIGPAADDSGCLFGCYSFPNHVMPHHPHLSIGVEAPTYLDALTDRFALSTVEGTTGTGIRDGDTSGIEEAVALAQRSDVVVLVVGDRSGMFGHGTSGEGCDAEDLRLPGAQHELVERVLATGARVVLVVSSGRPYALGAFTERAAAIVQTFFPGEEGGNALAAILAGDVSPSGRLPVQIPATPGAQPGTYLAAPLALRSDGVSNIDPTPAFPFGHGLAYTRFERVDSSADGTLDSHGSASLAVTVRNIGDRDGTEIVQLYLAREVASVVQPVRRLLGFRRITLEAGQTGTVRFDVPAEAVSFTGIDLDRVVEPGEITLIAAFSAGDEGAQHTVTVSGPRRVVEGPRRLFTTSRTVVSGAPEASPTPTR
jgi:beta-xylosidase